MEISIQVVPPIGSRIAQRALLITPENAGDRAILNFLLRDLKQHLFEHELYGLHLVIYPNERKLMEGE